MIARRNQHIVDRICEILWPGGRANSEWSQDEVENVAEVLHDFGISPHAQKRVNRGKIVPCKKCGFCVTPAPSGKPRLCDGCAKP